MKFKSKFLTEFFRFTLYAVILVPMAYAAATSFSGLVIEDSNSTRYFEINSSGQIIEAANETPVGRIDLPLTSFYQASGGEIVARPLDNLAYADSVPSLLFDSANDTLPPALVWHNVHPKTSTSSEYLQHVASPARLMFRVPDNYRSGGAFKLLVDVDKATTLDFMWEQKVNTSASALDTSWGTNKIVQTTYANTNPQEITLTISGETLAAGSWIDWKFWRRSDASATNRARVYGVAFSYNTEY